MRYYAKSAGITVHYCGEIFSHDSTLPSMTLKTAGTMASEYRTELSVKCMRARKDLPDGASKRGVTKLKS